MMIADFIMAIRQGAAAMPAYPRPDCNGLRVWCPWCCRWHYHGVGYGPRRPHCADRHSPFREHGYVLVAPHDLDDIEHLARKSIERWRFNAKEREP